MLLISMSGMACDGCERLRGGHICEKLPIPMCDYRVFADDIGMVCYNIKDMAILCDLFNTWQAASGLAVNYKKCVLIPLWMGWIEEEVRNCLSSLALSLARFVIAG